MLKWLSEFLFGKSLFMALNESRKVRVQGVRFLIKKVDVLAYLNGSSVLVERYSEYKTKAPQPPKELTGKQEEEARQHMAEVLVAGVVSPRLVHKQDQAVGGAVFVKDLFVNLDLVSELYAEIMAFTYGKKKVKRFFSLRRSSVNSTSSAGATESVRAST